MHVNTFLTPPFVYIETTVQKVNDRILLSRLFQPHTLVCQ